MGQRRGGAGSPMHLRQIACMTKDLTPTDAYHVATSKGWCKSGLLAALPARDQPRDGLSLSIVHRLCNM
eukprot:278989-Chlamydomonas_euryale.AAC.1